MPVFLHIETSQLICTANQLTGFGMRATLAFNGLTLEHYNVWLFKEIIVATSHVESIFSQFFFRS